MYRTYNVTPRRFRAAIVEVKKSMRITYSECVFVALDTQRAMRVCHIVICCLHGSLIFFHIISQTTLFSKESYKVIKRVF